METIEEMKFETKPKQRHKLHQAAHDVLMAPEGKLDGSVFAVLANVPGIFAVVHSGYAPIGFGILAVNMIAGYLVLSAMPPFYK